MLPVSDLVCGQEAAEATPATSSRSVRVRDFLCLTTSLNISAERTLQNIAPSLGGKTIRLVLLRVWLLFNAPKLL